ncbi:uncharacterized protein LOC134237932 [Saccostrea cucullata]|uniref:uncharacterized protein LOC134237932 n=1 Tax=Saccostrea cuccullata TaxID=36930 RepID=UPI002ED0C263
MRVLLLSSIFLSISTILLSSLGLSCPVTVPTVSYVSRCPSNETEWESAAQQKQCNKLATLQSCTETEKFVYHCVLNKDGTKYLEVCAQSWFMSGFCARFSVADGRIINDPGLDCTKFSTPCPSRFLSNESFKYQGCYDYLQQSTPSKIIEKKTPASERESDNSALIGLLCFFVMTTLLLPIIIVLVFKRKKFFDWCRSRRKDTEKCNDHTLEDNLLIKGNTAQGYVTYIREYKMMIL